MNRISDRVWTIKRVGKCLSCAGFHIGIEMREEKTPHYPDCGGDNDSYCECGHQFYYTCPINHEHIVAFSGYIEGMPTDSHLNHNKQFGEQIYKRINPCDITLGF